MVNDALLSWSIEALKSRDIKIENINMVVSTPWSDVYCFNTNNGLYYLKRTPKDLFIEAKVFEKLNLYFPLDCPKLIAQNQELCCFITNGTGIPLRKYLQETFELQYLFQGLEQFIKLQFEAESLLEKFLEVGVPDWRLNQFSNLYQDLLDDRELLSGEGLNEQEQEQLKELLPRLTQQCQALADLNIPQTLVQADCHTNNMLIDVDTKKLSFVDLGELVISHPLFSIHNYLLQAVKHHGIEEEAYEKLINICQQYWPEFDKAYPLMKAIFPVYSALGCYRLMKSIDILDYYQFYKHQHKLGDSLREYLQNA
jgi:Phosphotransferase enzyme family